MHIANDPYGEAYTRLIDYAMERCETFSLMDTRGPEGPEYDIPPAFALPIVEELKPFLTGKKWVETEYGTHKKSFPYDLTVYVWKCGPESAAILKKHTDHLLGWLGGKLPEDLCFQTADGEDWLWTVTHEGYRELRVTKEEAESLKETLRGTMLVDPESPPSAEELFEAALYHGADRLEFTGIGMAKLLPRLHELRDLRILNLFDPDIDVLPDELFDLPLLTEVSIMTSNLHGIPASIGRALKLEELSIYNGSHPQPSQYPEWTVPAPEQLKLTFLPKEIGQLERLRALHITYSGLRDLPGELANLKRLQYLSVDNHRIESRPSVLNKLRHVRNIACRPNGSPRGM